MTGLSDVYHTELPNVPTLGFPAPFTSHLLLFGFLLATFKCLVYEIACLIPSFHPATRRQEAGKQLTRKFYTLLLDQLHGICRFPVITYQQHSRTQ